MKTKQLVNLSLYTLLALALNYVEVLIPIPIPVPGAKLGLANLVTLVCLYQYGLRDTFLVVSARILLSGFLFGSFSSILYSFAGAITSMLCMVILIHFKFHIIIVSVVGGITHNLGQLVLASAVLETPSLLLTYGIPLAVIGFITGLLIGIITALFSKRLHF